MTDPNDIANPAAPRPQIEQSVMTPLVEKSDRTKYLSIIISFASLLITAFTFYFLNVQVRHDFKGTLYWVSIQEHLDQPLLTGEFLIVNRGNQYEVLRSVSFLLASDEECVDNFELSEHAGTLTFKPSESSVVTLSAHITTHDRENIKNTFKVGQRAYLCGYFNVLGSDGSPAAKFYKFGGVNVAPEGDLDGPFEAAKADHGLVDLLVNPSGGAIKK